MNKGISSITYDQFGNPFKVTFGNKSSIEYVYSADGVKLKARHITAIPQGTGSSSSSTNYVMSKDSTDYIGDFIYHNNKFSRYNWGNGYIVPTGSSSGYAYRFYIRDHQGNNRVVTTSTGAVKQTTHYYPDGVTHDKSTEQGEQVYKYNGKELDRMHGLDWYDYGAREYDPTIGQFISMDPLCEVDYHVSPYSYCAGDPVNRIDKDGRIWNFVIGAAVGAATDYVCQVTANVIENGRFSTNCITDVDETSILLAAGAGAITSGASAIGVSVARSVTVNTGSRIAGKIAGKVVAEGTNFVANVVAAKGDFEQATKDYVAGKAFRGIFDQKNISSLSNNKAVKAATEKVRSNGKRLSVDQKNAIRKENATTRKNAHKINNKIERENAVKNKFFDWTYGTHKYYEEKTR